jgi:hypothetical protein
MPSAPNGRRLVLAFLVAPLAAPIAYLVAVIVVQLFGPGGMSAMSVRDLAIAVFAVGAPLAYAATLVVGAPTYLALRALGIVRRWTIVLGAALIGAGVALAMSPHLLGDLFSIKFPWWLGALIGVVSAEVWWRVQGEPVNR